jgi:hypothetical protein
MSEMTARFKGRSLRDVVSQVPAAKNDPANIADKGRQEEQNRPFESIGLQLGILNELPGADWRESPAANGSLRRELRHSPRHSAPDRTNAALIQAIRTLPND